jgi:hypothetical protein
MKLWILIVVALAVFAVFTSAQDKNEDDIPQCRACHNGVSSRECDCPNEAPKVVKEYRGLRGVKKEGWCCRIELSEAKDD